MTNLKTKRIIAVVSSAVLLITAVLCMTGLGAFARDGVGDDDIHYYNDDMQKYSDNRIYSFGQSAYDEGLQAKENGDAKSVKDYVWHVDDNGVVSGNLRTRMSKDPALAGALTTDILNKTSVSWEDILGDRAKEFKKIQTTKLPDALHKAFLKDRDFWAQTVTNDIKFLKESDSIEIVDLKDYKSSMYMWNDMLDGNKPAVIVRKTTNAGGHAIVFKHATKGTLKWRLECGYQPIDVDEYWEVPDITIDDQETTKPHPTETTTETTTLAPKGKTPLKPGGEYGGGEENHDPDKTVTPEPTSPSEYKSPTQPTTKKESTTDGSKGTKSGSKTVDEDDGKQTTAKNGQDATVHAGDGKPRQDLGEVQQNHSKDTVEQPLQNDGTNTGDIDAPE